MCMCVCGGGGGLDEAISKFKGAGGIACPPTLILACVLPTVACSLDCLTKANPRRYLSDFKCKFSEKFIRS